MALDHNDLFSIDEKYKNMNDESLIKIARDGDDSALNYLFQKYNDLLFVKTHNFFISGAERDDIVQEARIGFYKAICSYDLDKQMSSFKTFANLCVERQLISAIKSSNRQKHIPLNSSFSLNTAAYDENDDTEILEILDTHVIEDPLDTITKQEYYRFVENKIDENLSDFEKNVLNKYIQGVSYVDIASELDTTVKSIDNAIQRIRKKAMKCLDDENEKAESLSKTKKEKKAKEDKELVSKKVKVDKNVKKNKKK